MKAETDPCDTSARVSPPPSTQAIAAWRAEELRGSPRPPAARRATSALDILSPRDPRFAHVVFAEAAPRARALDHTLGPTRRTAVSRRASTEGPVLEARQFVDWLFARAALDATAYRWNTIARRLPSCLRTLGTPRYDQARRVIESRPKLLDFALDALVVGVTTFFRDAFVFASLRDRVLATVAEGRKGLNVWSVGCSEGCELHSVAMLLDELGLLERSYLVGTDCRSVAIGRARGGVFDHEALVEVEPETVDRHFERVPTGWRVEPRLRDAARWWLGDALRLPQIGAWDVILCRNFAIYLYPEASDRLWRQLGATLRVGGVLVTGKAERPGKSAGLVNVGPCTYRRERGW